LGFLYHELVEIAGIRLYRKRIPFCFLRAAAAVVAPPRLPLSPVVVVSVLLLRRSLFILVEELFTWNRIQFSSFMK